MLSQSVSRATRYKPCVLFTAIVEFLGDKNVDQSLLFTTQISLKIVPSGPFENEPQLVQAVTWSRAGNKPLPEPMLTLLTDA